MKIIQDMNGYMKNIPQLGLLKPRCNIQYFNFDLEKIIVIHDVGKRFEEELNEMNYL